MPALRLLRARSSIGRLSLPLLVVVAAVLVGCSDDQPADSATTADEGASEAEPPPDVAALSGDATSTTESSPPPPRFIGRVTGAEVAPEPDADEHREAPSDERALLELQVGDCVDLPVTGQPSDDQTEQGGSTDAEVVVAMLIPCDDPHDAEVYARISLDEDPEAAYPGDEAVVAGADGVCLEVFADYVGAPYVDSGLEIVHLRPNEAAWVRGDRVVVCAVVSIDLEPLVGRVGSEA